MKLKVWSLIVVFLLTVPLLAQEATLGSPVPRTAEAKYKMKGLNLAQGQVLGIISVQDSGNVEIRTFNVLVPDSIAHPGATINGLLTAMDTVRSGETGGPQQVLNFRVLGYLFDQGYFPGTTMSPS